MKYPSNERPHIEDAVIEEALRTERLRSVPQGLHLRITNRLRIVAMAQQERKSFRFRLCVAGASAVVAIAGIAVTLSADNVGEWLGGGIPGGQGYFDYAMLSLNDAMGPIVAAGISLLSLTIGLPLLFLAPLASSVRARSAN